MSSFILIMTMSIYGTIARPPGVEIHHIENLTHSQCHKIGKLWAQNIRRRRGDDVFYICESNK